MWDKIYMRLGGAREMVADAISDYTTRGDIPPYQLLKAGDVLLSAQSKIDELREELEQETTS